MEAQLMSTPVSRREFLGTSGKTAAGVAAGLAVGPMIRHARAQDANDRLAIALIGCGGMGQFKLMNFMTQDFRDVDVVAICDVDNSRLEKTAQDVEKRMEKAPRQVKEFRKVIDMKDIDAVIVATPDHWHAIPMMLAAQAKKHVYCEKPCCHNIREGRAMVEAAKKYGIVCQVGTHQRSAEHIQAARDYIRNGKLGTISMTQTFTYGNESPDGLGHAPDTDPPEGVDYNTWLGPAPVRPFNTRRFHSSWRWYFDYGAGMVGDWNVHLQDIIMWSMGVTHPVSVSTIAGKWVLTDDRTTPDTMQAIYEFATVDNAPKGFVQTYTMRKASGRPWNAGGYGMEFHGTNGRLFVDRESWKVDADQVDWMDKSKGERTESFENKVRGGDWNAHFAHVENFLACVADGKSPIASIEKHYNTVVACHLANVSLRAGGDDSKGRQIFWDHEKELCFKDRALTQLDHEANKYLEREYRKGYELPQV
jgi:predicted dehydrogenase